MGYRVLADALVVLHGLFILFVAAGGFLVWYRGWLALLHLPAAVWGAAIELGGWICPLTPLENRFRRLAGGEGYPGGFVEHYLIPLIYPGELTRGIQLTLGLAVILVNVFAYGVFLARRRSNP